MEKWASVCDGWYEVSDLGNVRRLKPGRSTFVGRPVMPLMSAGGYAQVCLRSDSETKRWYLHHLVISAFVGERPEGMVINHKDGNKTNNKLENLEYVTYAENSKHARDNLFYRRGPKMEKKPLKGLAKGDRHWTRTSPEKIARGDKMPHCKLTPEMVVEAKRRVAAGEKQITVAKEFNISVAQMSRIIRGIRWTYL